MQLLAFDLGHSCAAFQVFLHERILKRYAPADRKSAPHDMKAVQFKERFCRRADV